MARRYRIDMRDTSMDTWYWWISTFKDIADTKIVHSLYASRANGMTCEEIEERTGLKHQTASGNLRHLVEDGDVVATKRRRELSSGRNGIVWGLPALIPLADRECLVGGAVSIPHGGQINDSEAA